MVVLPTATPVTNPVPLTVATPVVEDTQAFEAAGVPEPVNCVVPLIQAVNVPPMVGKAFMVTTAVTWHPLVFV